MTLSSSPLSSALSSRLGRAIKPVQYYGGFTNSDDIEIGSSDSDIESQRNIKTQFGKDEDSGDDDFDIGNVVEREEDEEGQNENTESEKEKTKSKSTKKTTKEVKNKSVKKGKIVQKQSKCSIPVMEIKRGEIAKTLTLTKSAHKAVAKQLLSPPISDGGTASGKDETGDTTNEDQVGEKIEVNEVGQKTDKDEDDEDAKLALVPPKLKSTPKIDKVTPKKPLYQPKGTAASSKSAFSIPRKKGFTPLKTIPLSSPSSKLFLPLKKTSPLLSSSSSFTLLPNSPAVRPAANRTNKSVARKAAGKQQVKSELKLDEEEGGGGEGAVIGEEGDSVEAGVESSLSIVKKVSATKSQKAVPPAPPGKIEEDDESEVGKVGTSKNEDIIEEQSSQTPGVTPKSTPKKRKTPSSLADEPSPSKKKPAPADKVTSSQRVVILEGLNQPAVYKSIDMNKLATSFGGDVTAPKLVRHWREVLFFDLKAFFGGEAAKKSPGKSSMGPEVRKGLWQAMILACDKVNWKVVEERTGVSTSKLKRHLRESMRKEGERFIAH